MREGGFPHDDHNSKFAAKSQCKLSALKLLSDIIRNEDMGSYEEELLGSGGTLLVNKNEIADWQSFFILYGDNLIDVNLSKIFAFHKEHEFPFTLGVFKTPVPGQCGIAEVGEDAVVINL